MPPKSFSIPFSESITPPSLATPSVEMEAVNGEDGETGERVVGPAGQSLRRMLCSPGGLL